MTPAAIEWRERMIARWSARAAELRTTVDPAGQSIAAGLEWIVAGLRRDLAAAAPAALPALTPPASSNADVIARQLAAIMPRFEARLGVIINDGPITAALRAQLQARFDGVAYLPPVVATIAAIEPPAEVVPFAMGPQLALFGAAA